MNDVPFGLPHVIGITGYAQHGKNTAALALEDRGYRPLAFADALRELAEYVNPLVIADAQKPNRYRGVVAAVGYEQAKGIGDVRRLLQDLGTGVRDIIGPDAWVEALGRKVMPGVRYVITDVRFQNERDYVVQNLGGQVWRVERPRFDNGLGITHASEAHIGSLQVDHVLLNSGTTEDLRRLVNGIASAYEVHA